MMRVSMLNLLVHLLVHLLLVLLLLNLLVNLLVLRALRVLRPCDPRGGDWIVC